LEGKGGVSEKSRGRSGREKRGGASLRKDVGL